MAVPVLAMLPFTVVAVEFGGRALIPILVAGAVLGLGVSFYFSCKGSKRARQIEAALPAANITLFHSHDLRVICKDNPESQREEYYIISSNKIPPPRSVAAAAAAATTTTTILSTSCSEVTLSLIQNQV